MADDSSQSPAIARKASAPKLASQGSAPGLKGAAKLKLAGKLVAAANQIADTAHAIQCTAHGPGLTGYIAQQIPVTFTIQAAGDGGAPATKGGHDFRVTVRGLDRVEPTMTDKGDGTYVVRLTYPMSGKYEVRVTLERSQIKGSPFEVTVRAAGRPAAPPQPSFGSRAAGRDVLEWAEPEHTGGCPLLSYSVWKLPKTNWQPGSGSSTSIFRPPSESGAPPPRHAPRPLAPRTEASGRPAAPARALRPRPSRQLVRAAQSTSCSRRSTARRCGRAGASCRP